MKKSVARPSDGVHRFFHESVAQVTEGLMDKPFLAGLLGLFRRGHRERRFNLPTLLWLGVFAAAHAGLKSMAAILDQARDTLVELGKVPLRGRSLTQSGWSRAKRRLPLGLLRRVWRHWVDLARLHAGEAARYRGMHLVALDKKSVRVPEALWAKVGSKHAGGCDGPAEVEMLVAYDVCVRVPLAVTLGRANTHGLPSCLAPARPAPARGPRRHPPRTPRAPGHLGHRRTTRPPLRARHSEAPRTLPLQECPSPKETNTCGLTHRHCSGCLLCEAPGGPFRQETAGVFSPR